MSKQFIVITTINAPTEGVKKITELLPEWKLIIVGDRKGPHEWPLPTNEFLSIDKQKEMNGSYARLCPENHYARKNIGYIWAIQRGAETIAETDDDNIPYDHFLQDVTQQVTGTMPVTTGWVNVYRYFTDSFIWPRGYPLEEIHASFEADKHLSKEQTLTCPVQQYLADGDPDVDAVYRLTRKGEIIFNPNTIMLQTGQYCPFNSQNTVWWPEAYPLLYLPSYVSFRMTDIWRSFVAQACLYKAGWSLAFGSATVYQDRNQHSLIHDFEDEISGYLNNNAIMQRLMTLDHGPDMSQNLKICYDALVDMGVVPEKELPLVEAWLEDIAPI